MQTGFHSKTKRQYRNLRHIPLPAIPLLKGVDYAHRPLLFCNKGTEIHTKQQNKTTLSNHPPTAIKHIRTPSCRPPKRTQNKIMGNTDAATAIFCNFGEIIIIMNNFHDLLFNRRSIRKYTGDEIAADDVKTILQAGLASPSSKGKMPWQFFVVEDKSTLESLSRCKDFGAKPIAGCALAIVIAVNPYESDVWIEDGSVAAFSMQMQAQDLGLGSCWIQVRERMDKQGNPAEENVKRLLGIPDDLRIPCILSIGYKNEVRKPLEEDKCLWEKVHIAAINNDNE